MLDLEALEKRVDEMIASDTPEEMMEWLLKKKMEEFPGFFPDGIIEQMDGDVVGKFTNPVVSRKSKDNEPFAPANKNFAFAA